MAMKAYNLVYDTYGMCEDCKKDDRMDKESDEYA